MNYAKIKKCDIANGAGIRVTLFVSGCPHEPKCKGCFNPETYDFAGGKPFTEKEEQEILDELEKTYVNGLTFLGGEPMDIRNQRGILPLAKEAKRRFPQKNIWCYTGFLWEEVLKMAKQFPEAEELLSYIDILVDGKFVEELHNPRLYFKGSSNQNIILVQESIALGKMIVWENV